MAHKLKITQFNTIQKVRKLTGTNLTSISVEFGNSDILSVLLGCRHFESDGLSL